jgi:hypothetical protein
MEDYATAVADLLAADAMDPALGAQAQLTHIRHRMEFTKAAFARAVLLRTLSAN